MAAEMSTWEQRMAERAAARAATRERDEKLAAYSAFAGTSLTEKEAIQLLDRIEVFAAERGGFWARLGDGEHTGHLIHGHSTHHLICTCGELMGVSTIMVPDEMPNMPDTCQVCEDWPTAAREIATPGRRGWDRIERRRLRVD
jgi:hypothetical protein